VPIVAPKMTTRPGPFLKRAHECVLNGVCLHQAEGEIT